MKTFKELKEEIARINNIDVEGFDSDWVLRKFARDQALINIELISPYTDKYELIVKFLVTGKDAAASSYAAASASAYAANDAFDTDASTYADTTYAAAYAAYAAYATDGVTAATAAYSTAYAATASYASYADIDTEYTNAIESLNTLLDEYLALAEQSNK